MKTIDDTTCNRLPPFPWEKDLSEELRNRRRYDMCDAMMGPPLKLKDADLSIPFVYDREYGLFHTPSGYHHHAMSVLLSWRLNKNVDEIYEEFDGFGNAADYYLREFPGTAFHSSVVTEVKAGLRKNLFNGEIIAFSRLGPIDFMFEKFIKPPAYR